MSSVTDEIQEEIERGGDVAPRRRSAHSGRAGVVEPAAGVPPVRTDLVVVAAALDNLVSNAIKYSQPGKQIHVRVCSDAGWGVCEVRDKGPGRPASVVE
jgi:signal transduction histidine kinase